MILRCLLLFLAMVDLAKAETARILSGEHADFTRLVVQLPAEAGWTVGRTASGYAFATQTRDQPDYDLSRVWDRIPRKRLEDLDVDSTTGALNLTVTCPCHVFPFEYQPGLIVLDIRNGLPPAGSAFEAPFSVDALAFGPNRKAVAEAGDGFDWLNTRRGSAAAAPRRVDIALDATSVALDPLRAELLEQISRGAAQGVVDMRLPGKPPKVPEAEEDLHWARIRIGDVPGIDVIDPNGPREALQADGSACLPDAKIAIADWGADDRPVDLIARARSGLYGEFDMPQPAAVLASVRLHLYLGLGAEARQYAALLPETEGDLPLLNSMSLIVDGEADPASPFAPMLACDGAAAFWAVLAHDGLPAGTVLNSDAVVRTFLGLPPHLRRHLGQRLALLVLERDAEAARKIRNAMERTPEVAPGSVSLLDARAALHADQPEEARLHAEAALSGAAQETEALIALIEAHFREMTSVPEAVVPQIMALQRIAGKDRDLDRATALALALSDRFVEAFEQAEPGAITADLWRVLSARGGNDAFLVHALQTDSMPSLTPDITLGIASRLAALGFSDAALAWLGPTGPDSPTDRRLVAAAAELSRGDARRALDHLAGLSGEDSGELRARAQARLGFLDAAKSSLDAAGKPEEAARLAAWAADWDSVATAAEPPWSTAAALVVGTEPEGGPLARGTALLEDSAEARTAVGALLETISVPSP